MAFGSIELTTISRAQDYTTIKHNEDNKVNVDQANFSQQFQKTTEQNIRGVHQSDDTQWHENKPDAREQQVQRGRRKAAEEAAERGARGGEEPRRLRHEDLACRQNAVKLSPMGGVRMDGQ